MQSARKLYITGSIDYESYEKFSSQLSELENDDHSQDVMIELASDGGSAHAALAFAARMRLTPCRLVVYAMGNVASAATLILVSGDKRYMTKEAWFMTHEDAGDYSGSVTEVEIEVRQARKMEHQWNKLMEQETGTLAEVWRKLDKRNTYLTAEQCLELGVVDEII